MKEFLSLFWEGVQGYYCVAEKTARGMMHRYYQSVDEAVKDLTERTENGNHLYFSPAVFNKNHRLQENVKLVKALWLDIDCAEEKAYRSKEEGLEALMSFVGTTNLPIPDIVDSGRGLHAYWVLHDPVTPEEWTKMATGLKSLCVLHNMKADPSRTSDSASLLRPVGTFNYKTDPASQVLWVRRSGKTYTPSDFPAIHAVASDTTADVSIGVLAPEFPESDAEAVLSKCAAMREIAEKKGAVEEPLWRGFLSVLYRCANGAKWCHDLSKGDPRYSFKETQEKAEGTKGPYTCEQFCSMNPETCKGCPFFGKVTSPIILGMTPQGFTPPTEANAPAVAERISRVGDFVVMERGVLKQEDNGHSHYITKVPLWVKAVREKAHGKDEDSDSSVELEWIALNGRRQTAVLPQTELYERKIFTKWLAKNNIRAVVNNVDHLISYITQCIVELMRRNAIERYYETLGWSEDGFVLGERIITSNGTHRAALSTSSSVANIAPKGNKQVWIDATAVYEDPSLFAGAFAVLCGFGSPLLHLCRYQSAVVSLFGPSGYGKTVAGSMALSIYGDPALLTQASSATTNAIGRQLAAHRSVPYFLDEVSNMPAYKLADFIYDAANGRQKDVLDKNRDLKQGAGWCLVPFISSNHSVLEMSTAFIQEAHRRRILEVPFDNKIDAVAAARLAGAYQDNFGTVAEDYLTYVITHKDEIRALVDECLAKTKFKRVPSVNRFGKWTIACAYVGGVLAKQLGLIKFDPASVVSKVLDVFFTDVSRMTDDTEIAKAALAAFLHENAFAINVWSGAMGSVASTAPRQVFARYNPNERVYFIQMNRYRDIIREAGLSIRGLAKWHNDVGIRDDVTKLGDGFPAVHCMRVPSAAVDVEYDKLQEQIAPVMGE